MLSNLLSIGIPTYNRGFYLARCIKSITSQGRFKKGDIEVLIIDNHSDADVLPIIKPFIERYPKIRFWRNSSNIGLERNILRLLENFKGRYFFFLSDDDELLPGSISKLSSLINRYPDVGLLVGAYKVFSLPGENIYLHKIYKHSRLIAPTDLENVARLFADCHVFSRICLRRDLIDIGGFRRHIGSMYPLLFPVIEAALGAKSYYFCQPLVEHRAGNLTYWQYTSDYMVKGRIGIVNDLARINPKFKRLGIVQIIKEIPDQFYSSLASGGFRKGGLFIGEVLKNPEIGKSPRFLFLLMLNFMGNTTTKLAHWLVKLAKKWQL
jgi:glycosyltransferase involved in cell wall biosynthesis